MSYYWPAPRFRAAEAARNRGDANTEAADDEPEQPGVGRWRELVRTIFDTLHAKRSFQVRPCWSLDSSSRLSKFAKPMEALPSDYDKDDNADGDVQCI